MLSHLVAPGLPHHHPSGPGGGPLSLPLLQRPRRKYSFRPAGLKLSEQHWLSGSGRSRGGGVEEGCRWQAKNAWILAALQARDLRLRGHWAAAPCGREERKERTPGSPGCWSPPVALPWVHGALMSRSFPTWTTFSERRAVSVRVVVAVVVVGAATARYCVSGHRRRFRVV